VSQNPRLSGGKIKAAVELYLASKNPKYKADILKLANPEILKREEIIGCLGRVKNEFKNAELTTMLDLAAKNYKNEVDKVFTENPFGVPYHPHIWGDGWSIQSFGVNQYYLQLSFPEIFDSRFMLNSLNFVLGNHPGENTSSFVSGVGSRSVTQAYGINRADRSFIPGGSVSGTGIIRPDFPELKEWPYFWQQTEYVLGGGATNFMFLVLAADKLLK
jgi:hypothetical protein